MTARRVLRIAGTVELVTLALLLLNLATVHTPAVSQTLGPIHGLAYTSTVVAAVLLTKARRVRLLALIPGVGGLLAARQQV